MTLDEISAFNAAWLQAWTDKDAARVSSFYADDCRYMDPNTAGGLQGCTDIPQRSTGPCQVGMPFGGYYDDSWKSYP